MKFTQGSASRLQVHTIEMFTYLLVFLVTLGGVIASRVDQQWFEEVYTVEDGLLENFTLVPLLITIGVIFRYLRRVGAFRSRMFRITLALAAFFSFFVAGEEISWGQRVLDVESPEFFLDNNAQQETNLHNLVVNGHKVNRILFSLVLTIVVGFYLLVLPVLYQKKAGVVRFTEWAGIPIPRLSQVIAAATLFVMIGLIPSGKNAEILEMGICSIFLMILIFPANAYLFTKREALDKPSKASSAKARKRKLVQSS